MEWWKVSPRVIASLGLCWIIVYLMKISIKLILPYDWEVLRIQTGREDSTEHLPEIRKLIFAGINVEAQALVNKYFVCKGAGSGSGHGN